jgi:hypothetical protein
MLVEPFMRIVVPIGTWATNGKLPPEGIEGFAGIGGGVTGGWVTGGGVTGSVGGVSATGFSSGDWFKNQRTPAPTIPKVINRANNRGIVSFFCAMVLNSLN